MVHAIYKLMKKTLLKVKQIVHAKYLKYYECIQL